MHHVQILARRNGAGLSRDLALLTGVLRHHHVAVTPRPLGHRGRVSRNWTRLINHWLPHRYDLNIMLERIRPEFIPQAHHNILIPNPEYFSQDSLRWTPKLDAIWCKTHHAVALMEHLHVPLTRVGFTSSDRLLPDEPCLHQFFHGPGRSNNKGTQSLIALWSEHPEWPTLTVVWRRKDYGQIRIPNNVQLISQFVEDHRYQQLQNSHRFHLCPSRAEGFGHYILEAMSCANVVITLDAPPMNELVQVNRGILVPAIRQDQQALAPTWDFHPAAMAAAIEQCLAMPNEQLAVMGQRARTWYLQSQRQFDNALMQQLIRLLGKEQ